MLSLLVGIALLILIAAAALGYLRSATTDQAYGCLCFLYSRRPAGRFCRIGIDR